MSVVMMVMVMVTAGALATTHFVLLKNLIPEGPVAVERKVGYGFCYSFFTPDHHHHTVPAVL